MKEDLEFKQALEEFTKTTHRSFEEVNQFSLSWINKKIEELVARKRLEKVEKERY